MTQNDIFKKTLGTSDISSLDNLDSVMLSRYAQPIADGSRRELIFNQVGGMIEVLSAYLMEIIEGGCEAECRPEQLFAYFRNGVQKRLQNYRGPDADRETIELLMAKQTYEDFKASGYASLKAAAYAEMLYWALKVSEEHTPFRSDIPAAEGLSLPAWFIGGLEQRADDDKTGRRLIASAYLTWPAEERRNW